MLERQREGIAKADGKYKGRTPTAKRQSAEVVKLHAAWAGPIEIAKALKISRMSVWRIPCRQQDAQDRLERL
jgi:DNA invertase Pin-like site-specific DNA recombinase